MNTPAQLPGFRFRFSDFYYFTLFTDIFYYHTLFTENSLIRIRKIWENVFDKLASLSKLGGQNGIILLCMHFHFKSIPISVISKVTRVDKAMIVANDTCLCAAILALFLEFHPGHRAEISHMNRPQNSSR